MPNESSLLTVPTPVRRSPGKQWRGLLAAAAVVVCVAYSPQAAYSATNHTEHGPAGRSYLHDFATDAGHGIQGPAGRSYLSDYEPLG